MKSTRHITCPEKAKALDALTDGQRYALRFLYRVVKAYVLAYATHDKGWRIVNDPNAKGAYRVKVSTLKALERKGWIELKAVELESKTPSGKKRKRYEARLTRDGAQDADLLGPGRWRPVRTSSQNKINDFAVKALKAGIAPGHFTAMAKRATKAAEAHLAANMHAFGIEALDRAAEAYKIARTMKLRRIRNQAFGRSK